MTKKEEKFKEWYEEETKEDYVDFQFRTFDYRRPFYIEFFKSIGEELENESDLAIIKAFSV